MKRKVVERMCPGCQRLIRWAMALCFWCEAERRKLKALWGGRTNGRGR